MSLKSPALAVDSYSDHKGTQSGLPSFDWTPGGTGALVPAVAPCAHLPPRGVQTDLGLPSVINRLELIKLRPLFPQRDNLCWDQSALVIRVKLSAICSKIWL
ncbi:uncharacterized protein LOC132658402 isoform X2 [Ovis aries]|uniref:uncharacterized protein LOC132658402 isoform X2 n=1 Tax=Ovis aries TaxID=9940 RepID=UPI0029527A95|nr:uncharacterized protein LOC132658402 isoform X2 [Ovis aries]